MKILCLKTSLVLFFLFIIISCEKNDERKEIEGGWIVETNKNFTLTFNEAEKLSLYDNDPNLCCKRKSPIGFSFIPNRIIKNKGEGEISINYKYSYDCGYLPGFQECTDTKLIINDSFKYTLKRNTISIDFKDNMIFDDIENAYFNQFIDKIYIEVNPDKYIILVQ